MKHRNPDPVKAANFIARRSKRLRSIVLAAVWYDDRTLKHDGVIQI
jgi:hypothetical protein